MIATERPRQSSSRRDTLCKVDYLRAIDHWINYFGEVPSSPPRDACTQPERAPALTARSEPLTDRYG
jgi:hypothetical protein